MPSRMDLRGNVALVTGASRGIGKGVAIELARRGAIVYITGRNFGTEDKDSLSLARTAREIRDIGGTAIPVTCDHSDDPSVEFVFRKIFEEQKGRLDILVNNAFAGVENIAQNMGTPFWELPANTWDSYCNVGLRSNYIAAVHAANIMVRHATPERPALIINIGSIGGLRYLFNVCYGVGKEANDRMVADMAHELKSRNVACVSLWPGPVRTELVEKKIFGHKRLTPDDERTWAQGETPYFSGLCIAALFKDPNLMKRTGKIVMTADLGDEYGLKDVDGQQVLSMRSLKFLLAQKAPKIAAWVPRWVKIPWVVFNALGRPY